MKKLALLALLSLLFSSVSYADVTLTAGHWSTTFDCAEREITYTYCNDHNYENICNGFETAICYSLLSGIDDAANFSGGGGGNGLFVQFGDGDTTESVGPMGTGYQIDFSTPQSEFWLRWHFRFQNGMPCSASSGFEYHKLLYIYPSAGSAAYLDDEPSLGFRLYNQENSATYGSGGYNFEDIYGSAIADGSWHSAEVYINTSTGAFKMWIYKHNADASTPIINITTIWPAPIDVIKMPENAKTDFSGKHKGVIYAISYDDIAVSTTGRIGPVGVNIPTPTPTPSPTPAPKPTPTPVPGPNG